MFISPLVLWTCQMREFCLEWFIFEVVRAKSAFAAKEWGSKNSTDFDFNFSVGHKEEVTGTELDL